MPQRMVRIEKECIYHIYNRGVNREPIFFSSRNYSYFLNLCFRYINASCSIFAYCLMPNHFHLLIRVESSNFVQSSLTPLLISYSKAINQEQHRVGPLFQGRFQANLIGNGEYLLECVKYIHLNPVRANLVASPVDWVYSSYRDYLDPENPTLVKTNEVYKYFSSSREFREFSEFGIDEFSRKEFLGDD
jgi:putative transposase